MSRPLETSELIQMLLEARQPHALVEVQGHVVCDDQHESYNDVAVRMQVVGVRSLLNKVILDVVE